MPYPSSIRSLFVLALIIGAFLLGSCQAGGVEQPSAPPSAPPSVHPTPEPAREPYDGASAVVEVPAGPRGIASAGGFLWVASTLADRISRVDPASDTVADELAAGGRPVTLVTLGDHLWASLLNGEASSDDEVVRIDPATGSVDLRVVVPVFHNIAAAAGAIWVVDSLGTLRRVDAASGEISVATNAVPNTVALAADNTAVWGIRGDRTVWRYPMDDGQLVEAGLEVAVTGRSRLAVGAGALWVAVPGTVLALDHETLAQAAELAVPGMDLVNDLFVTSSDVWLSANVTDPALGLAGGAILRLDPGTLEIRETYRLGPESSGVIAVEGSLWAVDQGDHRLARFPLAD